MTERRKGQSNKVKSVFFHCLKRHANLSSVNPTHTHGSKNDTHTDFYTLHLAWFPTNRTLCIYSAS